MTLKFVEKRKAKITIKSKLHSWPFNTTKSTKDHEKSEQENHNPPLNVFLNSLALRLLAPFQPYSLQTNDLDGAYFLSAICRAHNTTELT